MHLVTLNIDSRERTRRTNILTGTTTDAGSLVDGGNQRRLLVVLIKLHHLDSTRRTMTGTVTTLHLVCQHHTVLLDPYGMTNLDGRFLYGRDRLDGTGRTYLRAAATLRSAKATLV